MTRLFHSFPPVYSGDRPGCSFFDSPEQSDVYAKIGAVSRAGYDVQPAGSPYSYDGKLAWSATDLR